MNTPDYILTEEHIHYVGPADERKLHPGYFVRPIEYCYLPAHVRQDPQWKNIDLETHVFCYTRYGIMAIKRSALRQI